MELSCVIFRSRCWMLVINNYTKKDLAQLHTVFEMCSDFACQEEVGEKKGTPHIQGYICFKSAKAESVVRKLIPRGWWQRARKAVAVKTYSSKKHTRLEGGRTWSMFNRLRTINPGKPSAEEFMARCLLWYKDRYDV